MMELFTSTLGCNFKEGLENIFGGKKKKVLNCAVLLQTPVLLQLAENKCKGTAVG